MIKTVWHITFYVYYFKKVGTAQINWQKYLAVAAKGAKKQ